MKFFSWIACGYPVEIYTEDFVLFNRDKCLLIRTSVSHTWLVHTRCNCISDSDVFKYARFFRRFSFFFPSNFYRKKEVIKIKNKKLAYIDTGWKKFEKKNKSVRYEEIFYNVATLKSFDSILR